MDRMHRIQGEAGDESTQSVNELVEELARTRRLLESLISAQQAKGNGNGNGNGNGKRSTFDSFVRIASAVTSALVVAIILWASSFEHRVTVLESNLFTDEDARAMEERIKVGIPPTWFSDIVGNQGLQIVDLERRVRELERYRTNP